MSNSLSLQIATRIEEILKEQGLTRSQFADRLGKQPSVVSRWLQGDHNFSLATIQEIATALNTPIILVPTNEHPVIQITSTISQATISLSPNSSISPTPTSTTSPRRKYTRRCPSAIDKEVECNCPTITPEHHKKLANLPQVQQMKEANLFRAKEQADPDRWELWKILHRRFIRNIGKHGSYSRYTKSGLKKKEMPIRYYVENEFRKGHTLLYHFPDLAFTTPAALLQSLNNTPK